MSSTVTDSSRLFALVEELRQLCEQRGTGQLSDEEGARYTGLRTTVMTNPLAANRIPPFLLDCRTPWDLWGVLKAKSGTYDGRRAFLREEFGPLLRFLESSDATRAVDVSAAFLERLDSDHVRRAWQGALSKVETDPEGAMTAARTLMETVCKHLLDDLGTGYTDKEDLPKLYKLAAGALNLAPSQHTEEVFKQILGGATAVVEGIGALRNRLSDAHGKGRMAARPSPRHAEWVVNLALSTSVFLVRTWQEREAAK